MDAIYPYLTWGKDIVLSIYQHYDSGVGFCFIHDEKFVRDLEKVDGEKMVEMINDYICKSILNSDHKQGYAYARINDGKYEEYEYMPFFFDEEEWPPNGYD